MRPGRSLVAAVEAKTMGRRPMALEVAPLAQVDAAITQRIALHRAQFAVQAEQRRPHGLQMKVGRPLLRHPRE